jgi:hypothetical protein
LEGFRGADERRAERGEGKAIDEHPVQVGKGTKLIGSHHSVFSLLLHGWMVRKKLGAEEKKVRDVDEEEATPHPVGFRIGSVCLIDV